MRPAASRIGPSDIVLVTGATGFLGSALTRRLSSPVGLGGPQALLCHRAPGQHLWAGLDLLDSIDVQAGALGRGHLPG